MRAFPQADDRHSLQKGGRQRPAGQVGHVGDQSHFDQFLGKGRKHLSGLVEPVHRQRDEDVFDVIFFDQARQFGDGADDVEVARPAGGIVLDKANVANPHPVGRPQGLGGFSGDPAGADDDRERRVVTPAPQEVDQRPHQSPHGQDADEGDRREQRHGAAGDVGVLNEKSDAGDQQHQQGNPLEHRPDFLAEAPQPADFVILGEPEGEDGQDGDDRQVLIDPFDRGLFLGDREPTGKAGLIRAEPRQRHRDEVAKGDQKRQTLTSPLDHEIPD